MIAKELRLEGAGCFVWREACTQLCAGGSRVAKCFLLRKGPVHNSRHMQSLVTKVYLLQNGINEMTVKNTGSVLKGEQVAVILLFTFSRNY